MWVIKMSCRGEKNSCGRERNKILNWGMYEKRRREIKGKGRKGKIKTTQWFPFGKYVHVQITEQQVPEQQYYYLFNSSLRAYSSSLKLLQAIQRRFGMITEILSNVEMFQDLFFFCQPFWNQSYRSEIWLSFSAWVFQSSTIIFHFSSSIQSNLLFHKEFLGCILRRIKSTESAKP